MNKLEETSWSNDHERLLIDLWRINDEELQNPMTCENACEKISSVLRNEGLNVGWKDVRDKIEKLKQRYRIEKRNLDSPTPWEYFELIDVIVKSADLMFHGGNLVKASAKTAGAVAMESNDADHLDDSCCCGGWCDGEGGGGDDCDCCANASCCEVS